MALSTPAWHRIVLGADPAPAQVRLYSSYPDYRGISDRTRDTQIAQAVIVLALRAGETDDRVMLITPTAQAEWMLEQCEDAATKSFASCSGHPEHASRLAVGYTRLFKKLIMVTRPLQMADEPQHWVSFGFAADEPLPPWMPERLLAQG
jgi:hypothetical protein